MKTAIIAMLLLTATVVLLPEASAACEPGTNPDYCTGYITDRLSGLPDPTEIECWTERDHIENGIHCRF